MRVLGGETWMANRTSAPGRPAKACAPRWGVRCESSVIRRPDPVREPWSEARVCKTRERGATPRRTFAEWSAPALAGVALSRKVNRTSGPDAPGKRDVPPRGAWGASPPPSFFGPGRTWGRGETGSRDLGKVEFRVQLPTSPSLCPPAKHSQRCACLVSRRTRCDSGRGLRSVSALPWPSRQAPVS